MGLYRASSVAATVKGAGRIPCNSLLLESCSQGLKQTDETQGFVFFLPSPSRMVPVLRR